MALRPAHSSNAAALQAKLPEMHAIERVDSMTSAVLSGAADPDASNSTHPQACNPALTCANLAALSAPSMTANSANAMVTMVSVMATSIDAISKDKRRNNAVLAR
jgi:hypothetical protein